MTIHLIITPYDPKEWETQTSSLQIDINHFEQEFLKKWNNGTITKIPTGRLSWHVPEIGSSGFFGSLHSNKQIVTFSLGNWETFPDFVLWYRAFIPTNYRLFFFNSSNWESLELTENTTREMVSKFIG